MNYYEHHLGDYMRDTAHLSMLEDAAYRRLLDAYYVRERPLPIDEKECFKLARATTAAEKSSVRYVLQQFFELFQDGYRQSRADSEIARYKSKQEKAKRSANARWGKQERDANAMRTHSERNAHQTPDTRHHVIHNPPPPSGGGPPAVNPKAAASRGSRLAADWVLPVEWADWVLSTLPGWTRSDVQREAEKFRDYWHAKAGRSAVKADWQATWRNWCRSDIAQRANGRATLQSVPAETAYQRSMRERMEQICPSIAAKPPTARRALPLAEVIDVPDAAPTAPVARILG